jgi:hypothetical protein
LRCCFKSSGIFRCREQGYCSGSSGSTAVSGSYSYDEWFTVRLDINLDTGLWEMFINDISWGTWSGDKSVASVNLYPYSFWGVDSSFYVDDVRYTHWPSGAGPF